MLLLFTKHLLADFRWQTDEMVKEKGNYGSWPGIEHSLIHGLGTAVVLMFFVGIFGALLYGILDAVLHYHIDWTKININRKHNYTTADKEFWWWLGVDQFLHQMTYVLIAACVMA